MQIVLASSNAGKMAEIRELLTDLPIELISQSEFSIPDADETGTTFVENAIIKARHAAKLSGMPAISDDSGLAIDALGGAPGVYSARYAGEHATDADRIKKVLDEMQDVPDEDRTATFHCVTALMEHEGDPAPLICHGIWEGTIIHEPRGEKGFGYDPIFYVPSHECTAAQLDPKEKNNISHRGQALFDLASVLKEVLYS